MLLLLSLGAVVFSRICAVLLMPISRRLGLRFNWLDRPDGKRKVHATPIPRVGGLAMIVATVVCFGVVGALQTVAPFEIQSVFELPTWPILVGALLMAALGFADDLRDLHALPKLIVQSLIALLVVVGGLRISIFDAALGNGEVALVVSALLTVIWIVGIINGVNFVDGMDGLAGGVVAVAFLALGTVFVLNGDVAGVLFAPVMIGILLGFLRYNKAPASIFMGDVGSHFLGYMLAVFALSGTGHADPVVALCVSAVAVGLPVLDTLLTLIRRPQYDKPLLHSDGDHFHHRLMERYEKPVVLRILYVASVCFAVGAVLMSVTPTTGALSLLAVGGVAGVGFLYWLGYLPGRYATGPADAERVRYAMGVDPGTWDTRGDGAMFASDSTDLVATEVENGCRRVQQPVSTGDNRV
ncbi:MAG: MraY family glycosyltransferase [Rubricoccaceae bacterium]|nr:MraY family glycosyltransferase [Rubricoccaceae bacterium]